LEQLERRAWTPLKENTITAAVKGTNAVKFHVVHAKSHVSLRQNWKKFNDTEFRQLLQAYEKSHLISPTRLNQRSTSEPFNGGHPGPMKQPYRLPGTTQGR